MFVLASASTKSLFSRFTSYLSCQDILIISCAHPDMPLKKKGPHKGSIFHSQRLIKSSSFWGGYIGQAIVLCYVAATEMIKTNTPPPKKKRGKMAKRPWKPQITASVLKMPAKIGDSKHVLVLPIYKNNTISNKNSSSTNLSEGLCQSPIMVKRFVGFLFFCNQMQACNFSFPFRFLWS